MNSNAPRTVLTLALVVWGVVLSGRADVLIGTNGERFVGKVVEEKADAVVFDSALAGRLTIPRASILEIQHAPPLTTDNRLLITNAPPTPATVPQTPHPSPRQNEVAATEPSTNLTWRPPGIGRDGSDWIQLKSGEWLRGQLGYIQDRKVEFDSDELKELSLDLKNVRQVYPAKPLFTKFDGRDQIFGTVVLSNDVVQVFGPEQVSLPRDQLTGITPGGKREIDFWSGKANLGLTLQAGNTRQATETASAEVARRTPATVIAAQLPGKFQRGQWHPKCQQPSR